MVFGLGNKFGHLGVLGTAQVPPTGFVFLVDTDGAYLLDDDGTYMIEAA